jgi:chain length determinant protein (polysaccharide antigen chain regulator)
MIEEQKTVADTSGINSIRDDEIDLFDLWDDIVEEKLWVFIGFFACVLLAALYLFRATEIFQTQVVIKPASANSVVELNAPQFALHLYSGDDGVPQAQAIYSKTVDEAFSDARSALLSKEYRRNFYQAYLDEIRSVEGVYNEGLTEAQNFANFDKLFSSKVSGSKDVETFLQVGFELPNAQKAADLLNAYTEFSLAAKLGDIKNTIDSKIAAQVGKFEYDAMQLREQYKGEQTRRNLMLNEAYSIAQAVGQTQPLFSKSEIVGTYEPPLYMFGTKALRAEEKAIKGRQSLAKELPYGEDHFIDELPSLLFKIDQLRSLEIDYAKVNLAVVDEQAIVPVGAIKPKKLLVMALACVAGGFVGLMMALLVASFHRHKEKLKSKIKSRRWS